MNCRTGKRMFATAIVAATLAAASLAGGRAVAQQAAPPPPQQPAKDYNQRSLEIYEFRKAARSGTERGQEIFYYKCWLCHNEFVSDVPHIKGLYQKANLISVQPVSDESGKDKIPNSRSCSAIHVHLAHAG